MNRLLRYFLLSFTIISSLLINTSYGETKSVVQAKTDTNQIRIGEQFKLDLTVVSPFGSSIYFPQLADTFNHFEIVMRGKIDTLDSQTNGNISLKQEFTITAFDSGFFVLPPFTFLIKERGKSAADSVATAAALIGVMTIPVDTTKAFKDIKGTLEVPFPWEVYIPIALIILLLIGLIIYFFKKNKKVHGLTVSLVPKLAIPPHVIALEKLKNTESEKLWQQGLMKKFHSAVSDILREYIQAHYSIPALEFTSDETLRALERTIIKPTELEKLRYILMLADTVKFAKALPMPYENEMALANAYEFIEATKPVDKTDFEAKEAKV